MSSSPIIKKQTASLDAERLKMFHLKDIFGTVRRNTYISSKDLLVFIVYIHILIALLLISFFMYR